MKKIDFGREESNNPKGSFEKIGTDDGVISAELLDIIGVEGNNYLITKIIDDYNKNNEGTIYVKEAIVDLYADGSTVTFVNNGNKEMCKAIQNTLNSYQITELIKSGNKIRNIIGNSFVPRSFDLIALSDMILVTEINEDIFEEKKELIKKCHNTISSMQSQIESFYSKTR